MHGIVGCSFLSPWQSNSELSELTCYSDASLLSGDSPLKGTCTCHYENVPGPSDIFNMPASGNCADTKKGDLRMQ
jgi:hypothetical protein